MPPRMPENMQPIARSGESGGGDGRLSPAARREFREGRKAAAEEFVSKYVPEQFQANIKNPSKYYRKVTKAGKAGPASRLAMMQAQDQALGYAGRREALGDFYSGELGRESGENNAGDISLRGEEAPTKGFLSRYAQQEASPEVNLRQNETPTVGRVQSYISERLGVGMTPEEEAAVRGRMRDTVEGAARTQARQEGGALASSGMDPRSGVARSRMAGIANSRSQGLADTEREITLQDLARKRDMEGMAQTQAQLEESQRGTNIEAELSRLGQYEGLLRGTGQLEEAGRQFNVGADMRRRGMVEGGLMDLAGLDERRREYDYDFQQSKVEAERARRLWREYGESLEPSTLEQVSGGISGFLGGLTGGGGGGMMGGMGGMMGGGGGGG